MRLSLAGLLAVFFIMAAVPDGVYAEEGKQNNLCPNPEQLGSIKSDDEVRDHLDEVVASLPGYGEEMKGWEIKRSQPLLGTGIYYKMGERACGEKVAMHSWFVELYFPKLAPSESASHLRLFIAKGKKNDWFWWYRY